jgi:hypothetical protein
MAGILRDLYIGTKQEQAVKGQANGYIVKNGYPDTKNLR